MNDTHSPDTRKEVPSQLPVFMGIAGLLTVLLLANSLQIIAETPALRGSFFSPTASQWGAERLLAGEWTDAGDGSRSLRVSFLVCLIWSIVAMAIPAGLLIVRKQFARLPRLLIWFGLSGLWGLLWVVALVGQFMGLATLLQATVPFWIALTMSGCFYEMATALFPARSGEEEAGKPNCRVSLAVLLFMGIYVLIYTSMNWGLWFNLRLPHGDSAMYEEHLWNVLHGKGFRSYLDQGLFWGEHIQFVHLFLLPLYVLWPSQLYMELCESLALASGAIPVYWLALRSGGSQRAALLLSAAYLCYFPMQFLDIAIDLKTFRPIAFGIPLVLFALDQLERKHYSWAALLLALTLTCKEDYAIVVFSIGLSLLAMSIREQPWKLKTAASRFGLACLIIGPGYLLAALKAIRWFRSGVEVHYAGYFSKFGSSTTEIIWTMLTNPLLLIQELATINTLNYALAILLPVAFLPLRSPARLLSCLPMFVLLCLNELAQDPRHHFHAPLVPLLFWAAAGGLVQGRWKFRKASEEETQTVDASLATRRARFAFCCSLGTAIWFSMSPLGVAFWDTGSQWHWRTLYVPDKRAEMWSRVEGTIPKTARVASTDFIHPRFTHYERSYDYSGYKRRVAGNTTNVPEDTEYIVIDTRHPYSEIRTPEQIRELQESPEEWELLDDPTEGYFLVLKRKSKPGT